MSTEKPHETGSTSILRVAIMLDGEIVPNWIRAVVEDVAASDAAQIVLYILPTPPPGSTKGPVLARATRSLRSRWATSLFYRYVARDYARHRAEIDAFEPVDIARVMARSDVLRVTPIARRFSDVFAGADLEAIRRHRIDVILRFGFRILRGEILSVATYGVWSFHHGDNRRYRGGPSFFWELLHGDPVCGTVLQRLTEDLDNGVILHRSFSATNLSSLYATRNAAYWKAVGAVRRRLEDVVALGWNHVTSLVSPEPGRRRAPLYRVPGTPTMLGFLLRLRLRAVASRLRARLFEERWTIAIRERSAAPPWLDGERFHYAQPPRGRFYADPFLATRDGRTYVFFEEYVESVHRGRICVAEVTQGRFGPATVALELPHHLAYPYVFEWNGDFYMLPESAARRRIDLYRAASFPHEWELAGTLRDDVAAVDPTLHQADGRHWLFVGIAPHGAPAEHELHLFHGDTPLGPWRPHRANPVSSDIRRARPAGRLYRSTHGLTRPGQDCSVRYGYAIALSRITTLSTDAYVEEPFQLITPNLMRNCVATHTFDSDEHYEVFDAIESRGRLARPLSALASRLLARLGT